MGLRSEQVVARLEAAGSPARPVCKLVPDAGATTTIHSPLQCGGASKPDGPRSTPDAVEESSATGSGGGCGGLHRRRFPILDADTTAKSAVLERTPS